MNRRGVGLAVAVVLLAASVVNVSARTVICHHPGPLEDPFGRKKTITVGDSAVPAHLRHGDTLGACGSPPPPVPSTPKPSPVPTSRPTPRVMPSPAPTATPRPTAASTPTPAPRIVTRTTPMPTLPATDTE